MVPATFLVDGFVRGTWKTQRTRRKATLVIESFEVLTKKDRDALAEEGERLIRFMAQPEGAEPYEIRIAEPRDPAGRRGGGAAGRPLARIHQTS